MFNLQGSEIVILLLLALVVLGPEKLPDAIRKVGQFYAELRKMSSGFQSEFRAAVDEPMREMRDTASLLRDSADFTKLQDGEREEKPKSAEMGPVDRGVDLGPAPYDPPELQTDADLGGVGGEPALAADSKPAPFAGQSSTAPRTAEASRPDRLDESGVESGDDAGDHGGVADEPALAADSKPAPFAGQSSTAPRPVPGEPVEADGGGGEVVVAGDEDVARVRTAVDHVDESTAGGRPSAADDATGHRR